MHLKASRTFRRWIPPLLLCLFLLIAYLPALRDFFLADDFVLLTQAAEAPSLRATFAVDPTWFFYRPLGKLVWYIVYHLWSYNSAPYHLLSLGLHAINALLIVGLVSRLDAKDTRWVAWG